MAKVKNKREKISIATEIDRLEEKRERCQDNLGRAEFKSRKGGSPRKKELENEMAVITKRVQKLDKELQLLRGENRKNMLVSVALFAISALFYYLFFYNEADT